MPQGDHAPFKGPYPFAAILTGYGPLYLFVERLVAEVREGEQSVNQLAHAQGIVTDTL
jgi:hypothetical protein